MDQSQPQALHTGRAEAWPALPLDTWKSTCDTLHMYAQLVGKIRLALAPAEPQWAHVPLYVTARGLTTSPIPYADRVFQIDLDLIAHKVDVVASDGQARSISLDPPRSVAAFYHELMDALRALDVGIRIWTMPVEVSNPIRFTEDTLHAAYEPEYANRFWRILVHVDAALKEHRAPFRGRHTPVQFFWGTFDLAYARFSGRPATPPSEDIIMSKAMDAEEICAGFWPGDERFPEPAFWCYAYPKPEGIERASLAPSGAFWHPQMGEFMLRYEDVRNAESPRDALRAFFSSTYAACFELAKWNAVP